MVKTTYPESIDCYQNLIASSMASFGLKTVDTTIYAFVYCSLDNVSLDDVAKGTGYSLATVSTVAKQLIAIHLLKKVKKPGTKKVFLSASRNGAEMITEKLSAVLNLVVAPKKESLPKLISSLKKDIRNEKSASKKEIGKNYLKLLEDDLKETLLIEEIQLHILDYIAKKMKS